MNSTIKTGGNVTMARLQNKVALITGGSSGMGLATAKLFAQEGAKVVISGRSQQSLDQAEQEISEFGEVLAVQSDTAKLTDIETLFQKIEGRFGNIDILFANAGIGRFSPTAEITEEDFDAIVDINFKGLFFTVQRALKGVNDGTSIILNASWTAHRGLPRSTVYAATKAAVISLAQSLSAELVERKIRVNSISPGFIHTPILEKSGLDEQHIEDRRQQIPMKRWGTPEDVAPTVLFLASDESSYITGQDILIDGGIVTLWH
jgi:NAD(P)-dependent dehydrogenase (short-subunit alcohol dehydrogenase family)